MNLPAAKREVVTGWREVVEQRSADFGRKSHCRDGSLSCNFSPSLHCHPPSINPPMSKGGLKSWSIVWSSAQWGQQQFNDRAANYVGQSHNRNTAQFLPNNLLQEFLNDKFSVLLQYQGLLTWASSRDFKLCHQLILSVVFSSSQ